MTSTFAPALAGKTIVLTSGVLTLTNNVVIDASALAGGITIIYGLALIALNTITDIVYGMLDPRLRAEEAR